MFFPHYYIFWPSIVAVYFLSAPLAYAASPFGGDAQIFLNWWLLDLPFPFVFCTALYILTISVGYICLLMGGLWMSRLLKHNLMEDVFNRSAT